MIFIRRLPVSSQSKVGNSLLGSLLSWYILISMKFTFVLTLVLVVLALIFALQNTDQVSLNFFTLAFSGSVASVTIVTFIVGVVSGFLLLLPKIFTSTLMTRKLSQENKTFKKESVEKVVVEKESNHQEVSSNIE